MMSWRKYVLGVAVWALASVQVGAGDKENLWFRRKVCSFREW